MRAVKISVESSSFLRAAQWLSKSERWPPVAGIVALRGSRGIFAAVKHETISRLPLSNPSPSPRLPSPSR